MPDSYTRIFLLSHMRAYTSLAGHVLGSHPQINGYFEMHISYEDAAALDRQLDVLRQYETLKDNSRYIFDKLLHNDYRLDLEQPGLGDAKILVALLPPEQTIKSIVDLFAKKPVSDLYASPVEATRYYVERVQALAEFCEAAPRRYYYYDAGLWLTDTASLLSRLADWLELDSPLSEQYRLFSQTGKAHLGDSSALIRSGSVRRTRGDYSHISLPGDALDGAVEVYRDCRSRILSQAADALSISSQASRSAR